MKRVFIILDHEADDEETSFFNGLKNNLRSNCLLIKTMSIDPNLVLQTTLGTLRRHLLFKYNNFLVLHKGGEHFNLLKNNLPCDQVDLNLLLNKLVEVVGGHDTPQQKNLVCTMYASCINGLIFGKIDKPKNQKL